MPKIFITSGGFVAGHLKKHFKDQLCESIDDADIVINTIGILREEKHTYYDSHVKVVKELIKKCENKKLIHFSALGSKHAHPSLYKHTKAVAERLIKEHLRNYAILKPSIILGEGQKLYEDLKKFKNLPVIFVPRMKVQPITIEKVVSFTQRVVNEDLKGEFSLCGSEIISMKELFTEVYKSMNKKPIIIEMPKWFFALALPFLNIAGIMSKDEYLMIEDNICKDENV